eukprot:TRINITY_DN48193_c0_g1_i1.p1 TRINITY_DN48193_c0_g1~~TRINITY_DN48193_c0_g1_i1.p1  ORF type:complete len:216 (-),score=26.09 TRINITY_DN48193_c0_g1_i1:37-684(-)
MSAATSQEGIHTTRVSPKHLSSSIFFLEMASCFTMVQVQSCSRALLASLLLSVAVASDAGSVASREAEKAVQGLRGANATSAIRPAAEVGSAEAGNATNLTSWISDSDGGNRTAQNVTWRGLIDSKIHAASYGHGIFAAFLLVCCCSCCCYSIANRSEVRTMIARRDQRQKMNEIVEKEMTTRTSVTENAVGASSSFDGLLSDGGHTSTYTPPQL